jgi:hypothetical protein
MNEKLKNVGSWLIGLLCFGAAIVLIGLLIGGAAWLSDHLLPWFIQASIWSFATLILVLAPLSIIRKCRPFTATTILIISFIFGATVWMEGLLLTLAIWGPIAVVFGLVFMGIGVVAIAILATLFHGMWTNLSELVILVILTFASRFFSIWISMKADSQVE